MLSRQKNERLTQVGPGTEMGRLMREYWIPALLSAELPSPDCSPVRVLLLGERLVAFRDSSGRVGLLGDACPHRGASLFFGRSENFGLRCAYHGWKFDVTGACMEIPMELEDCALKRNVRAKAYPCVERGGIVWTYMGPRSHRPPLPALEANLADTHGRVDVNLVENNWLQALEGDIDIAHIPFLHGDNLGAFTNVLASKDLPSRGAPALNSSPGRIETADTPAGFAFAASRRSASNGESPGLGQPGQRMWFVGHFMFPFYANLPYGALGSYWVVARVPMDDHNTMTFGMWRKGAPTAPRELMFGSEPRFLPNTSDWYGRFRLARNRANDFKLHRGPRESADNGVGIDGQAVQDAAITASMGPIVDRAREHLGESDAPIIHLRRRLLEAMSNLDSDGAPAAENPDAYRVKHGSLRVEDGTCWSDELRRRGGAGYL